MTNIIVGLIIVAILGLAIRKIVVEKKKGAKCIGCPYGGAEDSKCKSSCND